MFPCFEQSVFNLFDIKHPQTPFPLILLMQLETSLENEKPDEVANQELSWAANQLEIKVSKLVSEVFQHNRRSHPRGILSNTIWTQKKSYDTKYITKNTGMIIQNELPKTIEYSPMIDSYLSKFHHLSFGVSLYIILTMFWNVNIDKDSQNTCVIKDKIWHHWWLLLNCFLGYVLWFINLTLTHHQMTGYDICQKKLHNHNITPKKSINRNTIKWQFSHIVKGQYTITP